MIDNLEKEKNIYGQYNAPDLRKLKEAIKSKRRGKLWEGMFLLQDNALFSLIRLQ